MNTKFKIFLMKKTIMTKKSLNIMLIFNKKFQINHLAKISYFKLIFKTKNSINKTNKKLKILSNRKKLP